MRYLRAPVGERGSAADNRRAIAVLKLVETWSDAMQLPDEAAVLMPAEECRYPHITRDGDACLVRVMADVPGEPSVELTVFRTPSLLEAFQALRSLEEYLREPTVEVAEVGSFGSLRTRRTQYRTVIMPDEPVEPAEVTTNA